MLERIPLTIRHRVDLGELGQDVGSLTTSVAWDKLRRTESPFRMAQTPTELAELASRHPILADRAAVIADVLERFDVPRVCSYAVGSGLIEYEIVKLLPQLDLVCTEFAPLAIQNLSRALPSATVIQRDLHDGPLDAVGFHLLHRADTEMPRRGWLRFFAKLTHPCLVVAADELTWRRLKLELRYKRQRKGTNAGWVRTEAAARRLFPSTIAVERIQVADLAGFLVQAAASKRS